MCIPKGYRDGYPPLVHSRYCRSGNYYGIRGHLEQIYVCAICTGLYYSPPLVHRIALPGPFLQMQRKGVKNEQARRSGGR